VESRDVARAVDAAISVAAVLDLPAEDAIVLHNSNKLTLRLLPCDIVARVAPAGRDVAALEVELARRLAGLESPAGRLDPRVRPGVYERDGYTLTLWSYYESTTADIAPRDYADALARLHGGLRTLDVSTPHFTDRVASAEWLVTNRDLTPELASPDRELLALTLRRRRRAIRDRGAAEQLLHGEPHPGNVLGTAAGPLFIDFETCCRGPIEFDLAHLPETVTEHYPSVDRALLHDCRRLVLAMVAAWRWELGDQLPDGKRAGRALLNALRGGPPWPTLDAVMTRLDGASPDRRITERTRREEQGGRRSPRRGAGRAP
jgi:hypothetical protein